MSYQPPLTSTGDFARHRPSPQVRVKGGWYQTRTPCLPRPRRASACAAVSSLRSQALSVRCGSAIATCADVPTAQPSLPTLVFRFGITASSRVRTSSQDTNLRQEPNDASVPVADRPSMRW